MNPLYEGNTHISYYDLDCHGRLKFSALLRMVHIAADINAADLGAGFAHLSPLHMSFVLQRFSAVAERLPAYGEAIKLRTWPAALERGTFIRKGDMFDKAGKKLMEWASLWLLFDINARKILRPSALPTPLEGLGDQGVSTAPLKIEIPADGTHGENHGTYRHTVRSADVDTNMHMNNAIYGDVVNNAIGADMCADWTQLHINYLAETRLNEEINVTARRAGDEILVIGEAPERRAFTAKVVYADALR